ncbi:MAG: LysM peptidoglycan-binding domain-containing protein [Bacteroidota bacterium]
MKNKDKEFPSNFLKISCLVFLSIVFINTVNTQTIFQPPGSQFLFPGDTLFIKSNYADEKIYQHSIQPQHTLFSLAKFFGLSVEELYFYNPGLEAQLMQPGQLINIPIPKRAILRYPTPGFNPDDYIPVCHIVQKGETMYRLSKVFYEMPIEDLMLRNGLNTIDLKEGQKINVGWMQLGGIPEEFQTGLGGMISKKNNELRKVFLARSSGKKLNSDNGVAFWKDSNSNNTEYLVLHRTARIGSIIEITNPMKRRVMYAKVVDRIPDSAYGDDVKVVVPEVMAKLLGAKDPRFFVELRYIK